MVSTIMIPVILFFFNGKGFGTNFHQKNSVFTPFKYDCIICLILILASLLYLLNLCTWIRFGKCLRRNVLVSLAMVNLFDLFLFFGRDLVCNESWFLSFLFFSLLKRFSLSLLWFSYLGFILFRKEFRMGIQTLYSQM